MLAGFTNTGHPSSASTSWARSAPMSLSRMERKRAWGSPAAASRALATPLSMAIGGACHAGAAVRHPGDFQQPLDGSVLSHGAVQQREHDQRAAARFGDGLDGFHGAQPDHCQDWAGLPRRSPRSRTAVVSTQRPSVVIPISVSVVAVRGDRLGDVIGRDARDLVLRRSPAIEDQEADRRFRAGAGHRSQGAALPAQP